MNEECLKKLRTIRRCCVNIHNGIALKSYLIVEVREVEYAIEIIDECIRKMQHQIGDGAPQSAIDFS